MSDLRKAAEMALEAMSDAELLLRIEDSRMHEGIRNGLAQACDTLRAALQREALNEVHQMDHKEFFSRAEIIRMAREVWPEGGLYAGPTFDAAARFAALVAAAEREACARVCETIRTNGDMAECWLEIAAAAIRARSKP